MICNNITRVRTTTSPKINTEKISSFVLDLDLYTTSQTELYAKVYMLISLCLKQFPHNFVDILNVGLYED